MKKLRWNFFVRLRDGQEYQTRAIPVEQDLQDLLTVEFDSQGDALLGTQENPKEAIAFGGDYSVGKDEVFFIDSFALPADVIDALKAPAAAAKFTSHPDVDWESVKAVFGGAWSSGKPQLVMQSFDRRRLLSTRFSIIIAGKTFSRMKDPGLILDVRAAAVFRDGRLFFQSYFEARKVLDLASYYREATDQDLIEFAGLAMISVPDEDKFIAMADSQIRRKVALIRGSGILERTPPAKIEETANKYGLPIIVSMGKIQLPAEKSALKAVLKLLDEDYFTSDLTGNRFLTNSKRPLNTKTP